MASPRHLPSDYDKIVPIENLRCDPLNPREEPPSGDLIDSMGKLGIQRALITRPDEEEDYYLVTNGWERVQAAWKLGWSQLPIKEYQDPLDAMKFARIESVVNDWDWYCKFVHIVKYYGECKKKDMNHHEAIARTVDDNDVSHETVRRYLRIWSLPPSVKSLLKLPYNRTDDEWNLLKKFNPNIKRYPDAIGVLAAAELASQHGISEERMLEIATNILDKRAAKARKIIKEACKKDNRMIPIREIIDKVMTGHSHPEVFSLPSCILISPKDKNIIMKHITKRRISLIDFLRELLNDYAWSLREAEKNHGVFWEENWGNEDQPMSNNMAKNAFSDMLPMQRMEDQKIKENVK